MHESVLRDYFLGVIDESLLNEDLEGSVVRRSHDGKSFHIDDMESEFRVDPGHLVKLCDAVLSGKLEAKSLELIGFCLAASDYFFWEEDAESGNVVGETAHDWSCPEINYPLTIGNVEKFRHRLVTGEGTFTRTDALP